MRALSTCGEPDAIKKRTHPKYITEKHYPSCPRDQDPGGAKQEEFVQGSIAPFKNTLFMFEGAGRNNKGFNKQFGDNAGTDKATYIQVLAA